MNSGAFGEKSRPFRKGWRWLQWQLTERRQPLNGCRGVFRTFAEARASAPGIKPLGYDAANAADWYTEKQEGVGLDDYPAVYWMRNAFEDSRSVFEIGGHVGVAYYGFEHVMTYPEGLTWTIQDVPSIAEAGRQLARQRGRANLHFVSDSTEIDGADVVLAAGSLQYIDSPGLVDMIARFTHRPRHIIINTTPVYDGPAFVTLQNIGTAYCPYRIFNRSELTEGLAAHGYALVASWRKDRQLRIPDHPDRSLDHYSGFYFRFKS